ncbi:TPA: spermidine/putrescine ABC transporter substrate-binding protein, partial [Legionella pneumophila]
MKIFSLLLALLTFKVFSNPVVNVYAWGGEIPKKVIHQFEQESGIKVNFSTYDSNETMYAKLRASQKTIYDVILPSAYFVERMQKQGML